MKNIVMFVVMLTGVLMLDSPSSKSNVFLFEWENNVYNNFKKDMIMI